MAKKETQDKYSVDEFDNALMSRGVISSTKLDTEEVQENIDNEEADYQDDLLKEIDRYCEEFGIF